MKKSQFISNPMNYFNLFNRDEIEIFDARVINEDIVDVVYNEKNEFREDHPCSNVVIAAFVTCYARLKLYRELLEKLNERVIYYDTDSCIFIQKEGDWCPKLGNYIGDLTDEIKNPNSYINKFVSCGPKAYSYVVYNPDDHTEDCLIKVKGVRLDPITKSLITFDSMKNILNQYIFNQNNISIEVPQKRFKSNFAHDILVEDMRKDYRFVFNKRKIMPDYSTRPFGYKN